MDLALLEKLYITMAIIHYVTLCVEDWEFICLKALEMFYVGELLAGFAYPYEVPSD